jgi:peroxiredoxin (alkyl hydroperoxide reductase subunit C)
MAPLKVGTRAPDFDLPACTGEEKHPFRLSDFWGKKNVVLAFHPLDWTPVCAQQRMNYQSVLAKFTALDALVVGISVDSVFSHSAWQKYEIGKVDYPMASDFWPHGEVASRYGILRTTEPFPGINERAVFVVDKNGRIAFSKVYDLGEVPDNEEVLEVLRRLAATADVS